MALLRFHEDLMLYTWFRLNLNWMNCMEMEDVDPKGRFLINEWV